MQSMLLPFDFRAFAAATDELDSWRERLDRRYPLSRPWTGVLRRDLEAESIAASTSMEGVPVTVDDVRRILAGDKPQQVSEADQDLVRGYREAMAFVQRRADDPNFQWNRELVVAVQDRVLAGSYGQGAGRMRETGVNVVNRGTGAVVFRPPDAPDVPLLVDEICRWMSGTEAHPALNSAWCHVAIAAVHPFRDGNGRTARVLASQAMYRGGFRSPVFTSLEEWWGHHTDDYYASFECLGNEFDPASDVSPFIESHIAAQLRQVRAIDLRERTTRGLWTVVENLLGDRGLPSRVAFALWDAVFGFTITSRAYRGTVDVSPASAAADLRAAVAAGLLESRGEGRARQYVAGEGLFASIEDELELPRRDEEFEGRRAVVLTELAQRALVDRPLD